MTKPTFRAPTLDSLANSSFIGFDRLLTELENFGNQSSYPPHNIYAVDDNNHVIEIALAGFPKDRIELEVVDKVLTVRATTEADKRMYIHHGISRRKFEKKFKLSPDTEVSGASFTDGLLEIQLHRLTVSPERQLIPIK